MTKPLRSLTLLAALASLSLCMSVTGDEAVRTIKFSDQLPFGQEPIDYFSVAVQDAVSRLQQQLDRGEAPLVSDDRHGYLLSVLKQLNVSVDSQLLVFSKTARNPDFVGPRTPRAVFFNDEVSVAWIPEARELEITALDVLKGATFYTLSQPLSAATTELTTTPRFSRNSQCLSCHAGRSSLDVPGLLVRAFQTDGSGKPLQGYSQVTHELDYAKRWGGWFVTGTPSGFAHRANLTRSEENERAKAEPEFRSAISELKSLCQIERYPTDRSDVLTHLVFNHQMHGLNLLIRVGMEARLARRSNAEEQLIRYLVFADEPALPVSLETSARHSAYRQWFEAQGHKDQQGRSLRQFDAVSRVFRYRLSYLVDHALFAGLPNDCRTRLVASITAGLSATEPTEPFRHMPLAERQAILEIARSTISAFAEMPVR